MNGKTQRLLEEMEQVAQRLDIKVSYEPMTDVCAGKGGLCKVKGAYRVIVDRRTTREERLAYLVEALAGFDLEGFYLSPQARELVALHRGTPTDAGTAESPLRQTA